MATQLKALTATPVALSAGTKGIRIQSVDGTSFRWAETATAPTTDALKKASHKDRDVWIDADRNIYIWSEQGAFDVVVT